MELLQYLYIGQSQGIRILAYCFTSSQMVSMPKTVHTARNSMVPVSYWGSRVLCSGRSMLTVII